MPYFLLCVSVALGAAKSVLSRSASFGNGFYAVFKSDAILFAVAFVTVLAFAVAGYGGSAYTPVWLAFVYAVCMLGAQISLAAAVKLGSVSVSSMFYSCGFVIPTLWSCLRYGEGVNAFHILGILTVLASFAVGVKAEKNKKFDFKWFAAALGGTVFSGFVGVVQKVFAVGYPHASIDVFLCTAFIFAVGMSVLMLGAARLAERRARSSEPETTAERARVRAGLIVQTLALGAVMGFLNKLNTYLSGVLPGAVMFPVSNCGVIALAAVLSAAVFKEKLSARQIAAIVLGFAAIAFIAVGQYY